jgi:precorrin-2 dehydrogenase/sirohydrochlorin ferrochelatase
MAGELSATASRLGSRKRLLPLLLNLENKLVVIFGGGSVGERKARLFSDYCCVQVVSLNFTLELARLATEKESLKLIKADLSQGFREYLDGAFLAIPATNDPDLNAAIEREAQARGILIDKVDGMGDVVVPSIIRKEPITIAIATESPGLTKYLRMRLEEELSGNYQGMAHLLGEIRPELKASVPLQKDRARIIWEILEDEVVWNLLNTSYEKAYMRARSHAYRDERDSLDVGDPPQGLDRRD